MKKFVWLLFSLLSLTSAAAFRELDLSGDFTGSNAGWALHGFEGFRPFAKLLAVKEDDGGKEFVQIRSVKGQLGALLFYKERFPAVMNDRVLITLRLRGKGIGAVCLHFFTKEGKWNGPSRTSNIKLKKHWENVTVTLPVIDGFAGKTHSFRICIGCGPRSEMDAAGIKAVFQKGKK